MKKCAVIAALLVAVSICMPTEAEICVLPYPTKVVEKKGEFKVPSSKKLTACVRFSKNASLPKEGYTLSVTAAKRLLTPASIVLRLNKAPFIFQLSALNEARKARFEIIRKKIFFASDFPAFETCDLKESLQELIGL